MIENGDRLRLPAGVMLGSSGLEDAVRRFAWPLGESARFVVGHVDGASLEELSTALAARFELPQEQALRDVRAFCADLNSKLLLNVEPRGGGVALASRWLLLAVRTLPFGVLPALPARRRPIDTATPSSAVASAARGLARSSLTIALLAGALAAASLTALGVGQLGTPLVLAVFVPLGVIAHEAGHAALLVGVPCCLATRGIRASVLHPVLTTRRQAFVAAAGPAAALFFAAPALAAALVFGLGELALATLALAAHALGLTVAAGDGRAACGLS